MNNIFFLSPNFFIIGNYKISKRISIYYMEIKYIIGYILIAEIRKYNILGGIMKRITLVLTLFLGVLLLASCSNGSKAGDSDKKGEENTLRVAMSTDIDSLDPFKMTAGDTETIMDQVFDGLFDVDTEGNLIPDLAESYSVSEDGKPMTLS